MTLTPADLFLSPDLTEEQARRYLQSFGFRDPRAADEHLQGLADDVAVRELLSELAAPLLAALSSAPDPDFALVAFSRYAATRMPRTAFLRYLGDDARALDVLVELMGTSPFLGEILIRNPGYFDWLIGRLDRSAPSAADLAAEVGDALSRIAEIDGWIDALKRFKRREILRIAARDILGSEPFEQTTEQISDLAEVVTQRSLEIAEAAVCAAAGVERLPGPFAVIALGKLGGRELNYSSDIDLIFVYETQDEADQVAHDLFQKLGRRLLAVLTEFTDESYLYRVDLRLRPMGRHGNIAYSLRQYGQYYDTWGETFERFALIKARPVAGDPQLGLRFVEMIQPFVFRKYLDHAALEEMLRYKVRAEQATSDLDLDVKVGRGGIREIEAFTQVLQLTYGAQNPEVRHSNTLAALAALARVGLVAADVHHTLARAYVFLRTVEHRLQIVQEQQTHALSRSALERAMLARRLGFGQAAALETELEEQRSRVHEIYRRMFEMRRGAADFRGRQFFRILTEDASESEAKELLAEHGVTNTETALEVIRSLDEATSLAPSRSTARNVLANLLATVMDRVQRCARPDQVLIRLEQVTQRTGAPASFLRTLLEGEALRDLLVSILDLGDLPASRLIRYPELLDSLLFVLPDADELRARYEQSLAGFNPAERRDQIRRFKAIEEFKVVVDWLSDGVLGTLQERLSLLADGCVTRVATWLDGGNGEPDWAIFALGKLGGRELTVHSDLDLVVLYRGDPQDSRTFLERQSFVREVERFLEEPTGEGVAYAIDTRLRPEGKKGALAMPLSVFRQYLETRAEIWERLAWTRARFLTGSPRLGDEVSAAVGAFVYGPWNARIPAYMTGVRDRMERELTQPGGQTLELKVGRGGLADIDFLFQMVQIREGRTRPEFRVAGSRQLLDDLPDSRFVREQEAEDLRRAHSFLRRLEIFARMDADTHVNAVPVDPERLEPLGKRMHMDAPAGQELLETYRRITERVRAIYENVLRRLEE
ncbi:MAG: hypothetical protein HY701_10625 [Gemmatimonadetes bacterium]|nr:hypothetical protein [Gemmatimonadota bacterium]